MTQTESEISGRMVLRTIVIVFAALVLGTASRAAASSPTEREVGKLLSYLGQSDCQFYRNGSWHNSAEARTHLERKYRHLVDRNSVATTEDFIDQAATASSLSGKPYQVKCSGTEQVPSSVWLKSELQRLRSESFARTP